MFTLFVFSVVLMTTFVINDVADYTSDRSLYNLFFLILQVFFLSVSISGMVHLLVKGLMF